MHLRRDDDCSPIRKRGAGFVSALSDVWQLAGDVMKKTDWFPGDVKPVRVGVYEQKNPIGQLGYQRWDGSSWYFWCSTVFKAQLATMKAGDSFQNDPWRGLASDPKGKK